MMDIVGFTSAGMETYSTQTPRAGNILSVQLGALEYAQDFGIDLRYFLSEPINFQDQSFQAYLVQALASRGINVASMTEVLNALDSDYRINLSPEEISTGLVAR